MSHREIIHLEQLRIPMDEKVEKEKLKGAENLENKSTVNNLSTNSESTAPVKENWGWSGESGMIKSLHYFLTQETFSMAIKIFRLCALIKCVPFELVFKHGESLRVRPFEKKWQWVLWHIVNWIIFLTVAFELISFGLLWQRASFGKEMAFHIMYIVASAWFFVFLVPIYRNPRACVVMLNHHDEIMRNSSRLEVERSRKHWASHPFVILSVYYAAWACILFDGVFVVFYLRHPERSQYIYSAFPYAWRSGRILYWSCAAFEFFWICCGFAVVCLYLCFWCDDIYSINGSLNQLRKRGNVDESTIESYLALQLFCVSFNDFNGGLFCTGFSFLLVISPVLFIYLSLTTFHMLSPIVYLAFPTFAAIFLGLIVLFLPQHSKVQIKSKDLLNRLAHLPIGSKRIRSRSGLIHLSHLTDIERRGYLRRRAKAFRRLRIQISFFGAFSLDTSAVMMEQIFNNILLLLSL